jgi:glycosyltransferase involved in cell wall biosynthesis
MADDPMPSSGPVAGRPRISVLLPVFMEEPSKRALDLLAQSLESVQSQDYPGEAELLLIDDGSPMPIAEALGRRAGTGGRRAGPEGLPLRILRSARNNGVAHACNLGLRHARFEWIARIDADDAWLPGKIQRQAARIAADPEITILGTGMVVRWEGGRRGATVIRPDDWSALLKFSADIGSPVPNGSILARADIFRLIGGYPQAGAFVHCEEYALWALWFRFFKPAMVESLLFNYLVSPTSVSVIYRGQQLRATLAVRDSLRRLALSEHLPGRLAELAAMLSISLIQAGVLCYRIWAFRPCLRLPQETLAPLRQILPDRQFLRPAAMAPARAPLGWQRLLAGFGPPAPTSDQAGGMAVLQVL